MGLSTTLLLVAVLTAVLPLAVVGLRPPESIRDLEKTFVVAIVTVGVGAFVTNTIYGIDFFGLAHLAYLLVVVTLPVLLGGWYVASVIRRRRSWQMQVAGSAAAVIALLGVWATHIEPNWLRTDRVAVAAPVQQPLTLAVIADLQTPDVGKHEWNAIETVLAEDPDIVLIPGDLFQGPPDAIAAATPDFIDLLQALTDHIPVVAVVSGDSDRAVELVSMVEAAGATFVDNHILEVDVRGEQIRIAGVSVAQSPARLNTIAALGDQSEAFTILLTHRPGAVYDLPPNTDVDLIVAGHTHGGQVAFPFLGPPVTLSQVPRSVAAGGISIVENYPLYVSTGVGLERRSAPQVRFGVRPSVGVIELAPTSGEG